MSFIISKTPRKSILKEQHTHPSYASESDLSKTLTLTFSDSEASLFTYSTRFDESNLERNKQLGRDYGYGAIKVDRSRSQSRFVGSIMSQTKIKDVNSDDLIPQSVMEELRQQERKKIPFEKRRKDFDEGEFTITRGNVLKEMFIGSDKPDQTKSTDTICLVKNRASFVRSSFAQSRRQHEMIETYRRYHAIGRT